MAENALFPLPFEGEGKGKGVLVHRKKSEEGENAYLRD